MEPSAMELVPEGTPFDFAKDLFPQLLRRGDTLLGLPLPGYWRDIGDPASYYRANLDAEEGRLKLNTPRAKPAAAKPQTPAAAPAFVCQLLVETPRKARLMRELSGRFMELGADFTNGLSLPGVPGGIHIAPCEGQAALRIESNDPKTAGEYRQMIENMLL